MSFVDDERQTLFTAAPQAAKDGSCRGPSMVSQRRWLFVLALTWLEVLTCGDRSGAQPDQSRIRVARLIERLGSSSYADRVSASEELAVVAPAARDQLAVATHSDDPEVRLRAKQLLRKLNEDELWLASRIDCHFQQAAASQCLAAISAQSGNRLLVGDEYGAFKDRPVDLDHSGAPFWQVVDQLCRQAGNRVRPHFDTRSPGLVVVAGVAGKHPLAYAGPVKVQINRARRLFSEELDYEQHSSEAAHSFQFDLQALWEDRFRLVAYRLQPELAEAVTNNGVRLSGHSTTSGWNLAGPSTRQVSMNLRIQPPSTSASSLKTLRLKWGLIAVGDLAQLDADARPSEAPYYQDGVELTVQAVEMFPGPRCEVTVRLASDAVVSEPAELVFCENEMELFDGEGRAYRKQGQTNTIVEHAAVMKVSFSGDDLHTGPKKLRLRYPRIRSQRDLEIVFRDVPLPLARPD
ncbi:MAG TPA: hypothetical protein VNH11_08030 [Pirellulales bacterium]|nr:hypothetical protein [Pirellulales bacterium]